MLDGAMDIEKINQFMGELMYHNSANLYRYKGLLAVAGEDTRVVFQASLRVPSNTCVVSLGSRSVCHPQRAVGSVTRDMSTCGAAWTSCAAE